MCVWGEGWGVENVSSITEDFEKRANTTVEREVHDRVTIGFFYTRPNMNLLKSYPIL